MLFTILTAPAAAPKTVIFDSGFLITVAFIVVSTLFLAFIKHIKKDKCIKSFESDIVAAYFTNGENIKGRLDVENTGCEFIMEDKCKDVKRSYILYKDEYPTVRFFVRYHKDMDERRKKERLKEIKKTYHPNIFRRIGRVINIFFRILRDSFTEVFSALSGRLKTANQSYATSEAYVKKVNTEAVSGIDATHNPLLEKYIGNKVVINHSFNGRLYDIWGILKDYSGEYLEILDAEFKSDEISLKNADMVLPRTSNKVRNLGEEALKLISLPDTFDLELYKRNIRKSLHELNGGYKE